MCVLDSVRRVSNLDGIEHRGLNRVVNCGAGVLKAQEIDGVLNICGSYCGDVSSNRGNSWIKLNRLNVVYC